MKIISFIERRQHEVIERILHGHQSGAMVGGLWEGPVRTLASPRPPTRKPRTMRAAIVSFCPSTPSDGKNRQKPPPTVAVTTPALETGPPQQSKM
jgi:hypothetical protein